MFPSSFDNLHAYLTIATMATVTYLTRVGGYFLFRNRDVSPKTQAILDAVPGCVLVSMLAPAFLVTRLADGLALIVTIVAVMRCSILMTLILSIGSAALLRYILPG